MSTVRVDPKMADYLIGSCTPPHPVLRSLAERTMEFGGLTAEMLVPFEQAALLTMLTKLVSAKTVIDVGTHTGCSALAFALGLAPGGKVITCDITDERLGLAREHWERAGMADRIDFRLGPAWRTLGALPPDEPVDIVFLDADELSYPKYFRQSVPLLRSGGLLMVDNVLLHGDVLGPELVDGDLRRLSARVVAAFNAELAEDDRLEVIMLPIADGLTIARKK